MSLETWKKEFYPVEAKGVSKEDAIEHSLQKWKGLSEKNLKKHGLVQELCFIEEEGSSLCMELGGESCALCWHDLHNTNKNYCGACPLAIARGGISCEHKTDEESDNYQLSPWHSFIHKADTKPMIYWLKQAKEKASEG